MDRWQYLIVLRRVPGDHRTVGDLRCRRLPTSRGDWSAPSLPVALVFVVWDAIAIAANVWSYNPQYITGNRAARSPFRIEEVLFFIVIPICGLLTYSAVNAMLRRIKQCGRGR